MDLVRVTVRAGRNLAPRDSNGLADPFCIVSVLDQASKIKKEKRTEVARRTLNPNWNGDFFQYEVDNNFSGIKVSCWCKAKLGKDYMGEFFVPVSQLQENIDVEGWFPLENRKDRDQEVTGEIQIHIYHQKISGMTPRTEVKKSQKEVEKQEKLQAKKRKQLEASFEKELQNEQILADTKCTYDSIKGCLYVTDVGIYFFEPKKKKSKRLVPSSNGQVNLAHSRQQIHIPHSQIQAVVNKQDSGNLDVVTADGKEHIFEKANKVYDAFTKQWEIVNIPPKRKHAHSHFPSAPADTVDGENHEREGNLARTHSAGSLAGDIPTVTQVDRKRSRSDAKQVDWDASAHKAPIIQEEENKATDGNSDAEQKGRKAGVDADPIPVAFGEMRTARLVDIFGSDGIPGSARREDNGAGEKEDSTEEGEESKSGDKKEGTGEQTESDEGEVGDSGLDLEFNTKNLKKKRKGTGLVPAEFSKRASGSLKRAAAQGEKGDEEKERDTDKRNGSEKEGAQEPDDKAGSETEQERAKEREKEEKKKEKERERKGKEEKEREKKEKEKREKEEKEREKRERKERLREKEREKKEREREREKGSGDKSEGTEDIVESTDGAKLNPQVIHLGFRLFPHDASLKSNMQHSLLIVNVIEARELDSHDSNGLSDPFVQLKLGKQTKKSKVIKGNLNPTWNEEFKFTLDPSKTGPQGDHLEVICWDWDRVGREFIGQVVLPLQRLRAFTELHEEWFTLSRTHIKKVRERMKKEAKEGLRKQRHEKKVSAIDASGETIESGDKNSPSKQTRKKKKEKDTKDKRKEEDEFEDTATDDTARTETVEGSSFIIHADDSDKEEVEPTDMNEEKERDEDTEKEEPAAAARKSAVLENELEKESEKTSDLKGRRGILKDKRLPKAAAHGASLQDVTAALVNGNGLGKGLELPSSLPALTENRKPSVPASVFTQRPTLMESVVALPGYEFKGKEIGHWHNRPKEPWVPGRYSLLLVACLFLWTCINVEVVLRNW